MAAVQIQYPAFTEALRIKWKIALKLRWVRFDQGELTAGNKNKKKKNKKEAFFLNQKLIDFQMSGHKQ